jgi:hypothetical protein
VVLDSAERQYDIGVRHTILVTLTNAMGNSEPSIGKVSHAAYTLFACMLLYMYMTIYEEITLLDRPVIAISEFVESP